MKQLSAADYDRVYRGRFAVEGSHVHEASAVPAPLSINVAPAVVDMSGAVTVVEYIAPEARLPGNAAIHRLRPIRTVSCLRVSDLVRSAPSPAHGPAGTVKVNVAGPTALTVALNRSTAAQVARIAKVLGRPDAAFAIAHHGAAAQAAGYAVPARAALAIALNCAAAGVAGLTEVTRGPDAA